MTRTRLCATAAVAFACVALAAPAAAQESSFTPGVYWDVGMIDVDDGRGEAYADWLAAEWKRDQEYAKSQGWIRDYFVMSNPYSRAGEPDLYLVSVIESLPDGAEDVKRSRAYEAWSKKNVRQLATEQAGRGNMRKVMGSMLLRELKLK